MQDIMQALMMQQRQRQNPRSVVFKQQPQGMPQFGADALQEAMLQAQNQPQQAMQPATAPQMPQNVPTKSELERAMLMSQQSKKAAQEALSPFAAVTNNITGVLSDLKVKDIEGQMTQAERAKQAKMAELLAGSGYNISPELAEGITTGDFLNIAMNKEKMQAAREQQMQEQAFRERQFNSENAIRQATLQMQRENTAFERENAKRLKASDLVSVLDEQGNEIFLPANEAVGKKTAKKEGTIQPLTRALATQDAKRLTKTQDAASSAADQLPLIAEATEILNSYGGQTGFGERKLSELDSFWARLGSESAKQDRAKFERLDQISKQMGIEQLKGIGGSDTERELAVAIETSLNPDFTLDANLAAMRRKQAAIDILSSKADFEAAWLDKNKSFAAKDPDTGKPFNQSWREFQKQMMQDNPVFGNEKSVSELSDEDLLKEINRLK